MDAEPLELSEMCTCGHSRVWHHSRRFARNWGHSPSQGVSHSCGCEEFKLRAARGLSPDVTEESEHKVSDLLDQLDLNRDEFLRIKAVPGVSSEVVQLCERAEQRIKQRVPLIKQRDDCKLALQVAQGFFDQASQALAAERDAARAEVAELKRDVANAVREAKQYCPNYPWSQETASEAVWALGQSNIGITQANDDWRQANATLRAQAEELARALKVKDEALKWIAEERDTDANGMREVARAALASQPAEQKEGV